MSLIEFGMMTATESAAHYAAGDLSPVEAALAALDRIDAFNSEVGAYCLVDREAALAAARESEKRWRRKSPLSAIDGVTASIKDIILTKGWPTLRGSRTVDPKGPWTEDAPIVARLREAGAVLMGKTTTPERGWKGVTDNPLGDVARNPWDTSKTAGGSSGGAAVAAALGMGALHVGTDGGGSIRIPAGFTGIFGFKPTYGLVPAYPPSPFGDVAHIGPMARSVADAAAMLTVIARPDPRDWQALPYEGRDYLAESAGELGPIRVAFSPDLGYVAVDHEIARVVADAAGVFKDLGATVEVAHPGFDDPIHIFHYHWYSGAAAAIVDIPESRYAEMDHGLREIAAIGAAYPHIDYIAATRHRVSLGQKVAAFFQRYDLLLTPTLPIPAFEAACEVPRGSSFKRWTEWTPFSYPFNLTQNPAAAMPCGFTNAGLPVSLQMVGGRYQDALVLRAARAFEKVRPIVLPDRPRSP